MEKTKDILVDKHFEYFKQMGWEHKENCICKEWPEFKKDELKEIEKKSFESNDDLRPEGLGF